MSRKGNCYDNTDVERVFRSLKEEAFSEQPPDSRAHATLSVIDYLDMFYNRQRLHSTLGYQSPNTFESQAAELNRGGFGYGPRNDRPMRGKYERRFFRASREAPKIITGHHYSHESLFSLSILIGPLQDMR